MSHSALFGYGSLVSRASAEQTLGRGVRSFVPVTIRGWRRRWSLLRPNRHCEKTFALADGAIPEWLLCLNAEPTGDPGDSVNGVLIAADDRDLGALAVREARYRVAEVPASAVAATAERGSHPGGRELPINADRIVTFTADPLHTAIAPPAGAIILASYLDTVETAFSALGPDQLQAFRATTGDPPVPVAPGLLVRHAAPALSPTEW